MEIWKDIKGYEGHYQVSNLGRIKSVKFNSDKILSPVKRGKYLKVNLCKNNKVDTKNIHTLVAQSFLNHTSDYEMVVDHIDNDGTNNNLDNLQIIKHRENISKDRKNCSSKYTGVVWHKKSKKWCSVITIDKVKTFLGSFDSELRASIAYNFALTQLDELRKYNLTK